MWIADVPNAPPSSSPVVMVAEASPQQSKNILGVCKTVNGTTSIYPTLNAGSYMYQFHGKDFFDTGATAKVIQSPKHGKLIPTQVSTANNFEYTYTPDQLPSGTKDYFVVSVENGGATVNIRYYIYINFLDPNEPADVNFCGEKQFWKISKDPNGNNILTAIGNLSPVAPW